MHWWQSVILIENKGSIITNIISSCTNLKSYYKSSSLILIKRMNIGLSNPTYFENMIFFIFLATKPFVSFKKKHFIIM